MSEEASVTLSVGWMAARFHALRIVKEGLDDLGHKGLSAALDRELNSIWRVISPASEGQNPSGKESSNV